MKYSCDQFVAGYDVTTGGLRSIDHTLVVASQLPWKDFLVSVWCFKTNALGVKIAWYPLSQNCAINSSALLCISGKLRHCRAAISMWGICMSAVSS